MIDRYDLKDGVAVWIPKSPPYRGGLVIVQGNVIPAEVYHDAGFVSADDIEYGCVAVDVLEQGVIVPDELVKETFPHAWEDADEELYLWPVDKRNAILEAEVAKDNARIERESEEMNKPN